MYANVVVSFKTYLCLNFKSCLAATSAFNFVDDFWKCEKFYQFNLISFAVVSLI